MNKAILFCAFLALSAPNLSALNITTTDGTVYENVKVTNVLPNAVGFMYTKKDGTMVVRDVKMTSLTKDLQKKFDYSPNEAKKFEDQIAKFRAEKDKLAQKQHQEELSLFREQKKFAKELNHVKALLYTHRIECWAHIIRPVGKDCIAKVSARQKTTKYGNLGSMYIRNLTGPQNIRIATTIYPTGKTKSFQDGMFPVYDANFNKYAMQLVKEGQTPPDEDLSTTPGKGMVFPVNAPKKK